MSTVEMVCFANSRKRSGRCVAGLRTDGGGWVRPVSREPDGHLLPTHYHLDDGTEARVLDVIRVDLGEPRPEPHQPENWLIGSRRWHRVARPASSRLLRSVIQPHLVSSGPLLGSTSDRLVYADLQEQPAMDSLALAAVPTLTWDIREPAPGRRHTRARFVLGDAEYNLSVTDPEWEYRLLHLGPGHYPFDPTWLAPGQSLLLTISLSDPFGPEGACFKIVASIVVIPSDLIS